MNTLSVRVMFLHCRLTSKRVVQHFHRRCYISPAPPTDLLVRAARPDLIVIRHVDIEYQLSPLRLEGSSSQCLPISRLHPSYQRHPDPYMRPTYPSRVLRPNLEPRRIEPDYLLLEIVGGMEGIVSDIHIALKREREFSVREELGGDYDEGSQAGGLWGRR